MDKPITSWCLAFVAFVMSHQTVWSQPTAQQINPASVGREAVFGSDLAFYEDRLLVGKPGDSEVADWSGAVEVYEVQNGAWTHIQTIRPALSGSSFGWLFEVAENQLFVWSGAGIYAFTHRVGVWEERQLLTLDDGFRITGLAATKDHLMVRGSRRVVNQYEGAIYAYRRQGGQAEADWVLIQKIQPSPGAEDGFGSAFCIVGNELVALARGDGAYVFSFENEMWSLSQRLWPASGRFGRGVVCDRSSLLFTGAPGEVLTFQKDDNGDWYESETIVTPGENPTWKLHLLDGLLFARVWGEVTDGWQTQYISPLHVFQKNGGSWMLMETLRSPHALEDWEGDEGSFGESVAVTSQYLAVGSPYRDEIDRDEMGEVHIFDRSSLVVSTVQPPHSLGSPRFSVFPNPASPGSVIRIHSRDAERFSLTVFDALGRVIHTVHTGSNPSLDVGKIRPGVYIVRRCGEVSGCSTRSLVLTN